MDVLAAWGGMRPYCDLPFPGLIDEPVADLELHWQDSFRRRLSHARQLTLPGLALLALLLRPWLGHPRRLSSTPLTLDRAHAAASQSTSAHRPPRPPEESRRLLWSTVQQPSAAYAEFQ